MQSNLIQFAYGIVLVVGVLVSATLLSARQKEETPVTTTHTVVDARHDAPVVPSRWTKFRFFVLRLPILQLLVLLALILWLVISIPAFVNRLSIVSVLILAALLAFAALGQTFVVLIGGLDLAIPGYIIVGAFISSNLAGGAGWPIPLARDDSRYMWSHGRLRWIC